MAKFITGNELNAAVEKIFEQAESTLILISPFISLHGRYVSVLKSKQQQHNLTITVVFGKNEENYGKSMQLQDLQLFMDLPNIEIRYEKNLHAKYYANEYSTILTSMNLIRYSQDNNIEAGVQTKTPISRTMSELVGNTIDTDAWLYFQRVIKQADILFKKVPKYESAMLGLTTRYTHSEIEIDRTKEFFKLPVSKIEKPVLQSSSKSSAAAFVPGFCIRTGKQIPFDTSHPLCDEAYKSWSFYKNADFQENFCHFSGEPSDGETSYAKPILKKNWQKAKPYMRS